jgi:hypothetical protein
LIRGISISKPQNFNDGFSGKVVNKSLNFDKRADEFLRQVLENLGDNHCDEDVFE